MIYAELKRTYKEDATYGVLDFYYAWEPTGTSLLTIKTIELPWELNQRNISCIPEEDGYDVIPRWSGKFGQHYHILNVPNRSFILFHVANYVHQLRGCIAVGLQHKDINKDGIIDIANSVKALNQMHGLLKGRGFVLHIESEGDGE